MPIQVIKIIQKLKKAGFTAFIAGGAVRDLILGITPKDFDIATSAKPEEIEKNFKNTKPVGKEFGVILVVEDGLAVEVATFRADLDYSDNRRPNQVVWASAKEDAQRRDFTINALFLDPDSAAEKLSNLEIKEIIQESDYLVAQTNFGQIIDYVGGLKDLEDHQLKFVGDPIERINEDHLRIIRAIRFKAVLGFDYNDDDLAILKENIDKIKNVSAERILVELNQMLASINRDQAIRELDEIGALKILIPELEPLKKIDQSKKFFQAGNAFDHTILVLKNLSSTDPDLAWAALLHDIGKAPTMVMGYDRKKNWTERFPNHNIVGAEMAAKIFKRLKFPRDRMERILWLIENHQMPPQILTMREGKKKRWLLDSRLPDLLALHRADAMGKEKKVYLGWHDQVKKIMDEELAKPLPPPRLLDGNEIMAKFNLKPGPEIGRLLNIVEEAQWEGEIKTKEEALKLVEESLKNE